MAIIVLYNCSASEHMASTPFTQMTIWMQHTLLYYNIFDNAAIYRESSTLEMNKIKQNWIKLNLFVCMNYCYNNMFTCNRSLGKTTDWHRVYVCAYICVCNLAFVCKCACVYGTPRIDEWEGVCARDVGCVFACVCLCMHVCVCTCTDDAGISKEKGNEMDPLQVVRKSKQVDTSFA